MSYPRKIKGFRDIDATLNQLRWKIVNEASKVYKKYGFEHLDTPVLEYAENLGKYLPESNEVAEGVYSFKNPETEPQYDSNGNEIRDKSENVIMTNHSLIMRYDLTAPLARHYSESLWEQYKNGQLQEGKAPLKRRYQYGPVYRFEAKLDPGRFREFWQIDFDTVGSDDVTIDAENCIILSDAMEAIGLKRGDYVVKINNRKIVKGLLQSIGIDTEEQEQLVMRIIDKADKIGIEGVKQELGKGREDKQSGAFIAGINLPDDNTERIMQYLGSFTDSKGRKEVLKLLKEQNSENSLYVEGLSELEKIDLVLSALGFEEDRVIFDPTMIRGMGYYTGPIFEVEYLKTYKDSKGRKRKVGSICGGGRYDGLVKNLLGIKVPATGASIGIDRLAEILTLTKQSPELADGPVLIVYFDDELMPVYQKIAQTLRANDIETEIYYGSKKQLKHQLNYADKKNCPYAILLGTNEYEKGIVTLRNLKLGKKLANEITDKKEWREKVQKEVKIEEIAQTILSAEF